MSLDWWTLGIQFLNVAILVWLLVHFFWKPVSQMIDERRDQVARTLADAEEATRKVEADRGEIAEVRKGFQAEREKLLSQAREEARQAAAEVLARARKEAAELRDEASKEADREREAAEEAWRDAAAHLAVDIARKLLATQPVDTGPEAFLDGVVAELSALPDRAKAAGEEAKVEVTSAAPLATEERKRCRDRLHRALGRGWTVEFVTDPDLLAGLEVAGPSFVVRNSWRATLDRIQGELNGGPPA